MLSQIVITVAGVTLISVLTCLVYTEYFHRCELGRDVGDELRALAARWRQVAASHRRELMDHLGKGPGDVDAYTEHRANWLAYEACARRLEAVLREAEAAPATTGAPPPPPRPSKEIWPSG